VGERKRKVHGTRPGGGNIRFKGRGGRLDHWNLEKRGEWGEVIMQGQESIGRIRCSRRVGRVVKGEGAFADPSGNGNKGETL